MMSSPGGPSVTLFTQVNISYSRFVLESQAHTWKLQETSSGECEHLCEWKTLVIALVSSSLPAEKTIDTITKISNAFTG